MRLAVLALLGGLALAALLGGRPGRLPARPLRWPALSVLAVFLYWVPSLFGAGRATSVTLMLCAYGALLAFAAANLRVVGMAVVALGLGLNAAVILANGGMPVDPGAVVATGLAQPEELARIDLGPNRQWQGRADPLAALGDVVPVAPLDEVVSFGDLILAAGLANVGFRLLQPRTGDRSRDAGRGGRAGDHRARRSLARLSPAR